MGSKEEEDEDEVEEIEEMREKVEKNCKRKEKGIGRGRISQSDLHKN